MTKSRDDTNEDLRASGLKATLPRARVLQLFHESGKRHWSAEEVYRAITNTGVNIGFATVYRVLMQFEQAGILMRQTFEGDHAVYELNDGSHHDHLICIDCNKVIEFFDNEIENRQTLIAEQHKFAIVDHQMTIFGKCRTASCTQKERIVTDTN